MDRKRRPEIDKLAGMAVILFGLFLLFAAGGCTVVAVEALFDGAGFNSESLSGLVLSIAVGGSALLVIHRGVQIFRKGL